MRLYHRTYFAKEILVNGFKNGSGKYGTNQTFKGVWLSNIPLDPNEGAFGDSVLMIEIPVKAIKPFEWIEEGKPYREFCAPADLVNQYGPPKIIEES